MICFKISLLSVEALNLNHLNPLDLHVASAIVVLPHPGLPYKIKENKLFELIHILSVPSC